MSHPYSYPMVCVCCGTRWSESNPRDVEPTKASDGEVMCSPECAKEYDALNQYEPDAEPYKGKT